MKVILYAVTGVILLVLNVWYIRSVYRTFWSSDLPDVIAPFQFIGREDKDGSQGRGLARMLVARLDYLQREINEAEGALTAGTVVPPPAPSPPSPLPQPVDGPRQITQRSRVLDVPDIQVKVSGVDVTGFVAWAYRGLAEGRSIRTTVYSPGTNQQVTVAVSLETPRVGDLWIGDVGPNDGVVVDEVAMEIVRQFVIQGRRIPEAAGLDRKQFREMIESLRKIADLNQRVAQGYLPPSTDYADIANRLEPLTERTPGWRALIDLAAQAAENARDLSRASRLYQRELLLVDRGKEGEVYERLEKKIAALNKSLEPAGATPATPAHVPVVKTWPLGLLAVPVAPPMQRSPRVAVLGSTPSPDLLSQLDSPEVLNRPALGQQSREMQNHTDTAVAAIQAVAPKAHFIFAATPRQGEGGLSLRDLTLALQELLQAKPQVLVIPLRPPSQDPAYTELVARAAKECVVVVAAGNDGAERPAQFEAAGLLDVLMSVAAVGKNGGPAEFSSRSDKAFWAPGVDIPLRFPLGGRVAQEVRSGTTYSASLAAGVVARVLDRKPDLMPPEVLKLLRDTAKPAMAGGPPVLNLAAALEKLP